MAACIIQGSHSARPAMQRPESLVPGVRVPPGTQEDLSSHPLTSSQLH